jgi:hypothetical protein
VRPSGPARQNPAHTAWAKRFGGNPWVARDPVLGSTLANRKSNHGLTAIVFPIIHHDDCGLTRARRSLRPIFELTVGRPVGVIARRKQGL